MKHVRTPMADGIKDTNPKDAAAVSRIPLTLCSPIAKAHWALAQFAGMIKYGAWNWRVAGVRSSVYLSAAQRHLDAYLSGEEHDPVDGTHHLGNIMACCAIVLDAKEADKLTDDRPPSVSLRPAYATLEALATKLRAQYADREPRHYTIEDSTQVDASNEAPIRKSWPPSVGDEVQIKRGVHCGDRARVIHIENRDGQTVYVLQSEDFAHMEFSLDELSLPWSG